MGGLTPDAKARLLRIARESIVQGLEGRRHKPPKPAETALIVRSGAFVTISRAGALRGCIGTFEASKPLYLTVADMARSAAFDDPRFPPLQKSEYATIGLEISVLTPLRKLDDPSEVTVGRHGVYIVRDAYRGVLLPQVATEYGWDRVRFLEETCRKAGLPRDAWREGAEIYVFEAEVFGEKVPEGKHTTGPEAKDFPGT